MEVRWGTLDTISADRDVFVYVCFVVVCDVFVYVCVLFT